MGGRIANVVVIAILGIVAADALARPKGLDVALNGVGKIWSTTVGGLQASSVPANGLV